MAYTETKSRDQLKKTFTAFLDHCQGGLEDEVTRSADNGAMPFYPLGIDSEQREALEEMGEEIIRQMPDEIIERLMKQNGATSLIAKVYPKDGEPYIMHNERNAGYVVHCISFSAMAATDKADDTPRTFADFCSGVPKALKMEFPFYDWDAEPGPQPGPAPKARTEALPTLPELRQQKAIIPHTNVFRSLTRPEPWGGEWQQMSLPGWPINELKNSDAVTYLSLELETEESGIKLDRKISLYDKSVLTAAINLFEAGNDTFTSWQLCSWMKGTRNNNSGIDESSIKEAEKSLEKQQLIRAKISATETFRKRGITEYDGELKTYLLPIEELEIWGKGKRANKKVKAYHFIKEPPILTHARATKQIYTAPVEALQTGNISATKSVIILRNYLMERIEAARGGKLNRKILYSTIYDDMEIIEPSIYSYADQTDEATGETIPAELAYKRDLQQYYKKTAKTRKNVKYLLDNWVKQGYIKGYTESKKGKTLEGVTINFAQEKKKPSKKGK